MKQTIKSCPYCGSEYFVSYTRVKGLVPWIERFDGDDPDAYSEGINSSCYEGLIHSEPLKTIRCYQCRKKVNQYFKM